MKKRILISVLGVLLSGFLIFGVVSYCNHQTELKRNREYETSLAKALKNSYKDIKEIQFSDPSYSDKPGGWYVHVQLTFSDGTRLQYETIHSLNETMNHNAIFGGKNHMKYYEKLSSKEGSTDSQVIIVYSTKDKEILK